MAESVAVQKGFYDKLESVHCGVSRKFKINCGPEQLPLLEDGKEHTFEMTGITAKRNGDEVNFSK